MFSFILNLLYLNVWFALRTLKRGTNWVAIKWSMSMLNHSFAWPVEKLLNTKFRWRNTKREVIKRSQRSWLSKGNKNGFPVYAISAVKILKQNKRLQNIIKLTCWKRSFNVRFVRISTERRPIWEFIKPSTMKGHLNARTAKNISKTIEIWSNIESYMKKRKIIVVKNVERVLRDDKFWRDIFDRSIRQIVKNMRARFVTRNSMIWLTWKTTKRDISFELRVVISLFIVE